MCLVKVVTHYQKLIPTKCVKIVTLVHIGTKYFSYQSSDIYFEKNIKAPLWYILDDYVSNFVHLHTILLLLRL